MVHVYTIALDENETEVIMLRRRFGIEMFFFNLENKLIAIFTEKV